ncbi:MAG: hypothetical protein KDN22_31370 [Verrucomicrobiae bacterium]|nr:hypothetical protein [Verrucomicrobiae bacterium]
MRKIILTQQQLHLTSIENDGDGDYGTVMEFSAAAPRLAVLEGVDTVTGWTYLPNLEYLGLAVDAVVDIPSMARLKVVRSAGKEVRLRGALPALTYYESDGPCQNSLSGLFPKLRRVAVTPEGHPADHVHLTLEGEFPNLLKLEAECDVEDWSFLKDTSSLRSLKAEECHALESLSVLNELRLLALKNVRSLVGLSGVHSLQALDIEGESIRGADVSLHLEILRLAVSSLEGVDSFRPSKLQIAGIRPHIEPIQVAEFDWLESLDHLDSLSIAGCHPSVLLGSGLKWPSSRPTVDTLRFLDWAPLSEGATLDLRSAEPARVFCGPRINSFSQINTGPRLRHLSVAIVGGDEGLGAFRNLDSLQVRGNEGWAPLEPFRRLAGMHYLRKNLLVRVPAEASRFNQDFHTFVAQGTADWLFLDYLHTNPSDNPVEFFPWMYRDLPPPSNKDELACFAARAGLKESDLFRAVTISAGKSATDLRSIVADADAVILTDVSVIPDLGSAQIDSLELRFADWGQYSEAGMCNSLPRLQAIRGLKRLVLRNVGDVILHLDELGSLPELESLTLSGAFGICDFQGLDNFPQLKSLTLEVAAFGSADSFPDHGHEHLTDLTLIDCKSAPGEPFLRRLFPSLKAFRLGRE